MVNTFKWPLRCHPDVRAGVRVPFSASSMLREYLHPTFAIHQHHYRGRVTIEKKTVDLRPGDLTITPPGVVSRYELEEAGYHWCVHFKPVSLVRGAPAISLPLHIPMHGGGGHATERMRAIADTIGARPRSKAKRELAAAAAGTLLQELLLRLALDAEKHRPSRRHHRKSDALLDAARERIDQKFSRPLAVADLAGGSGLSRNYFSARFRERFGMTVDAYLLHRRMEMAGMLLISTRLPIKEIAFECGIPDPHYFNKQFRRATGSNPTDYRARNSNNW